HGGEQLVPPPERADAGGAVDLVAGEGVEVAAQRGDVDLRVRHRLRPVDDDRGAGGAREPRDLRHRVDGAERVGDVHAGDDLHATGGEQARELLQAQLAALVDGHHA